MPQPGKVLAFAAALAVIVPLGASATSRAADDPAAPTLTPATFSDPPATVRPKYRWWQPLAATDDNELMTELQQLKDLGAGGGEETGFAVTGTGNNANPFLSENGWGSKKWAHEIQVQLQAAKNLGLDLDITDGPRWPPTYPTTDNLNQVGVAQQLIYGREQDAVGTTRTGQLPATVTAAPVRTTTLFADAPAGASISVTTAYGFSVGDALTVGSEAVTITAKGAIDATTGRGTFTVSPALAQAHTAGETLSDPAKKTLVAVLVAQCASTDCPATGGTRALDFSTVKDVTGQLDANGNLSYAFTDANGTGAPWWVMNYYATSDGKSLSGFTTTGTNYSIDYLSAAGAKVATDFYDGTPEPGSDFASLNLLDFSDPTAPNFDAKTPSVRSLVNAMGTVDLFEDSLELSNGNVRWTPQMLSEWQSRRGYDVIKYLPAIGGVGAFGMTAPFFDFTNVDGGSQTVGQRVRIDYRRQFSDLFIYRYADTLKAWANANGMKTRIQAYGASIDTAAANGHIDVPEGESLTLGNDPEKNKLVSVGAHMTGNAVTSFECCAMSPTGGTLIGANLPLIYKGMAGGVTQQIWHGFPYLTQPVGTGVQALWPGMSFGGYTATGESWGPRNPNNSDYRKVNDSLARLQLTLRQGAPRFDVAVYWQDYGVNATASFGGGATAGTLLTVNSAMARAGYTYEYLSPEYLNDPAKAVYENGALFPGQSAYKALVLNTPQRQSIRRDAAEKILALAKQGLPVVIIGATSSTAPTVTTQGYQKSDDAAVQTAMNALYALIGDSHYKVSGAATEADVPAALTAFGVGAAAAHATQASQIYHLRRHTADTDYYFFYDNGTTAAEQTFTLAGTGIPYRLNTWTGGVEKIAQYKAGPGTATVKVALAANDVAVIAISTRALDSGSAPALHVEGTTADSVAYKGEHIAARATSAGTVSSTLSDGRVVSTAITNVPAPITLGAWTLNVDGVGPGASDLPGDTLHTPYGPYTVTVGAGGVLPAWTTIPALSDVSGVGVYTTLVDVGPAWTGGTGAYLNLGSVTDTTTVAVNGVTLPPLDYSDVSQVDVGPYLHSGANAVKVTVASTLSNAVRVAPGLGTSTRAKQNYGLVGPVVLTPYGEADVYSQTSVPGGVSGSVPATLSLVLGAAAAFGPFTPGVAKDYAASTTADVVSTAGDAALRVSDPTHLMNGAFALPSPLGVSLSKSAWSAPVSHDAVTIGFKQHVGATDALRTGAYSATLTFTLSTTTP